MQVAVLGYLQWATAPFEPVRPPLCAQSRLGVSMDGHRGIAHAMIDRPSSLENTPQTAGCFRYYCVVAGACDEQQARQSAVGASAFAPVTGAAERDSWPALVRPQDMPSQQQTCPPAPSGRGTHPAVRSPAHKSWAGDGVRHSRVSSTRIRCAGLHRVSWGR